MQHGGHDQHGFSYKRLNTGDKNKQIRQKHEDTHLKKKGGGLEGRHYVLLLLFHDNGNVAQRDFSQRGGKRCSDIEIPVQQETPQGRPGDRGGGGRREGKGKKLKPHPHDT